MTINLYNIELRKKVHNQVIVFVSKELNIQEQN